ncbi:DUF1801 domain-containing protein [Streptosporangium sp. CA-135522]|uniref:DUF1801 domain-containing protein n=1 Tax=Streptosporangium sp. CA-135522 TaxID=3240072 RepID=UPI003D8D0AD8
MAKFDSVQDYLNALPEPQQRITDELLPIIEAALPGTGALYQGHPVWSAGEKPGKSPVCYVKAYPSYVTFGFWKGQMLSDPSGRLDAGAREMAGIKLRSLADIDAGLFTDWLRQARAVEASTGS